MKQKFTLKSWFKCKFQQYKRPFSINDIGISKIVISNKLPLKKHGFKYFIGYKDSGKIRPLCKFRQQMIVYNRNFDENRHLFFNKRRKSFY